MRTFLTWCQSPPLGLEAQSGVPEREQFRRFSKCCRVQPQTELRTTLQMGVLQQNLFRMSTGCVRCNAEALLPHELNQYLRCANYPLRFTFLAQRSGLTTETNWTCRTVIRTPRSKMSTQVRGSHCGSESAQFPSHRPVLSNTITGRGLPRERSLLLFVGVELGHGWRSRPQSEVDMPARAGPQLKHIYWIFVSDTVEADFIGVRQGCNFSAPVNSSIKAR